MKILMVAPEPIFEPRGTPFSVVGRLKALSDMGHSVDLLTYHLGRDVEFPGVRLYRIPRVPGIGSIKIGPSLAKIPLDILLFFQTVRFLARGGYDLLHTHEEAGIWGTVLARAYRIPHLYDMHSSLPQQLHNFQFTRSRILVRMFEYLEKRVLREAAGVITICPDLHNHVDEAVSGKGSELIENVVDYATVFGERDISGRLREDLGLGGKTVALYTGTFEPYQGIDLLLTSAVRLCGEYPDLMFVLVGGHESQVDRYREIARSLNIIDRVIFTGQVEPDQVKSYIRLADVLLSPRTAGTNTPLKIYDYMKSGKPVAATDLLTHTQVLSTGTAFLAEPEPGAFSRAIEAALRETDEARRKSDAAFRLAQEQYSYNAYMKKFARVLRTAAGGG